MRKGRRRKGGSWKGFKKFMSGVGKGFKMVMDPALKLLPLIL